MKIADATLAELRAEYLRLAGVVADAQDMRAAIQREIEKREFDAENRVARMSPVEREATRLALQKPEKGKK